MAMEGFEQAGQADGIRCDTDGNIWSSAGWVGDGYDGVHVFAPDGDRIGLIRLPEICSNVCFGGVKRNRLFIVGTLREEGLLDDTVICFTSDHGDMLGRHGMWAKRLFYEPSANIPMILVGSRGDARLGHHRVDDRIAGWQDVMPTLLDLAGIEIPSTVEGLSMVGEELP